jgi:hypothetical protein
MPARKQSLKLVEESDYILKKDYAWITVENLSVQIKKTDEGVVVDIWPLGEEMGDPIASTYAFFSEALDDEDNDG